jgi:hypothetical protein
MKLVPLVHIYLLCEEFVNRLKASGPCRVVQRKCHLTVVHTLIKLTCFGDAVVN